MKRRLISFMLVMMICLALTGNALALSSEDVSDQTRGAITVSCGLTQSGGQYVPWSRTRSGFSENLTATVYLYRIVNGSEVFVTSSSAGTYGTSVTASTGCTLSAGTYKVYGYGTGDTTSGSTSRTYTIS
jgi:hypothetical protein